MKNKTKTKMPELVNATWQEECPYVDVLQQIRDKRGEVQDKGRKGTGVHI